MNKTQSCLSREVLDQIGRDEILPNQLQCIEDHVSECEHCRDLFAAVTAEPDWTDGILPILCERRDAMPGIFEADQSCGHDSELSLLGPTDDPRMLGRIGPYEVTGVIGRGGMGIVFKAFDASLNRFVAIKMLLPHLAASGAARKRFSREGQAAAAVVDDHVLPIYGVNQWQGVPYLVTQYSSGMSLQKRIQDQAPLALKEILRISLQASRGLAAAHAQGLVHRDVKPSNILLDSTVERALLTDFGLARAVDDASITRSGTIAGTPQFMAPEQARGESVDQRSDLFSLGAVIYAMCTGHPPFRAETSYGVLRRITDEEPRPIREINSDIPEWLCGIVAKLMAKQPDDRFASASEVAELLEQCLAHVQQPTMAPIPETLNTETRNHRPPLVKVLLTAVFTSLLLFAGVLFVLESNKGSSTAQQGNQNLSVTPAPKTVKTSVAPTIRYSEATEIVLSMGSIKFMLDFDTGQTMDPPARSRPEQKQMDIHPIQDQPYDIPPGLAGLSLRGVRTKPRDWNVTVDELQKALASDRMVALTKIPYDSDETATYFFRTADGAGGILQLLARTNEPQGIRVRYKTLVAAQPAGGTFRSSPPVGLEFRNGTDGDDQPDLKTEDLGKPPADAKVDAKGKLIATVLGKPIHEADINKNLGDKDNLIHLLFEPLMEHYCKQQGIGRDAELKAKIKDEPSRAVARIFVMRAELNRHLYEKYGGRVQLTAFGPVAFDGQIKWFEDRKKAGDFTITNAKFQEAFDELWVREPKAAIFASPSQIKDAFDPAITERFIDSYAKIPAGAAMNPDTINRELAGLKVTVHHDFAKDGVPRDRFTVRGDGGSEHIAAKADGLHVTHPGRAGFSSSSVQVQLRAHGNFEITATFQNLSIDPGDDGSAGLSLTAILDNADYTHGNVYRGALLEPGNPVRQITQSDFVRNPQNERIVTWRGTTPEEATSGRLRLSRVGETLYCLFAPNDSPQFRLIRTENVGKESLLFGGVRLEAAVQSNGNTPGTTSVLWKDITIRAERITDWAGEDSGGREPAGSSDDTVEKQ